MKRICENGDSLVQGKFYLYNNLWGADTGLGSQCLWQTSLNGSRVAWGTGWNWSGNNNLIKSYAAVILGWHGGWKVVNTGLPVQLSSVRNIHTSWSFKLTQEAPSKTNVTYDMWLSDRADHGTDDATGEVMIWLANTGDVRPIGSKKTTTTLAETEWDLWIGHHPVSDWPVYSFVRTKSTDSESLNLIDFFRFLFSYGLESSIYLLGIEAGTEVFSGMGRLETILYSVDIETEICD